MFKEEVIVGLTSFDVYNEVLPFRNQQTPYAQLAPTPKVHINMVHDQLQAIVNIARNTLPILCSSRVYYMVSLVPSYRQCVSRNIYYRLLIDHVPYQCALLV